jgi:hypothetical protein
MGSSCRTLSILLFIAAIFAFENRAPAQSVDTSSQRTDVARTQTETGPTVDQTGSSIPSTPNDADLGEQEILKRAPAYQAFTAAASVPIYWTSNVLLSRGNEAGDWIEAPAAGLYYQPRITNNIYGLVDVRDQQFYYNRFDELNFGNFAVDVGLNLVLPQMDNLILRAQYTYDRLTEKDSFDAFFQNHEIILNAELPVRIGRAQQLAFGTSATISMRSIPESPRRNDYEGYIGYTLVLTRALTVNAAGRLVVRDYYHQNSRVDVNEIGAVTATYNFNRFFSATALGTFAANQSNQSIFDYKVGNVGGAFSLAIKF